MKHLVLLMGYGEMPPWDELSEEEQAADMARFEEFGAACDARDGVQILAGEALGSSADATVVRTRGGRAETTDGPYAEAVEHLGGFYLLEAPDVPTVVDLLRHLPAYDMQISPVIDPY